MILLNVSGPFHSKMLVSAGEELAKEMENIKFHELKIPYVTNVTAEYVTDIKEQRHFLQNRFLHRCAGKQSVRKYDCKMV